MLQFCLYKYLQEHQVPLCLNVPLCCLFYQQSLQKEMLPFSPNHQHQLSPFRIYQNIHRHQISLMPLCCPFHLSPRLSSSSGQNVPILDFPENSAESCTSSLQCASMLPLSSPTESSQIDASTPSPQVTSSLPSKTLSSQGGSSTPSQSTSLQKASLNHLRDLYKHEFELACPLKLAPSLTQKSLYPNNTEKQNVNLMLKVFDNKNVLALQTLQSTLGLQTEGTQMFIMWCHRLWQVLNTIPQKNIFVSGNLISNRLQARMMQISYFSKTQFLGLRTGKNFKLNQGMAVYQMKPCFL